MRYFILSLNFENINNIDLLIEICKQHHINFVSINKINEKQFLKMDSSFTQIVTNSLKENNLNIISDNKYRNNNFSDYNFIDIFQENFSQLEILQSEQNNCFDLSFDYFKKLFNEKIKQSNNFLELKFEQCDLDNSNEINKYIFDLKMILCSIGFIQLKNVEVGFGRWTKLDLE